MSRDATTVIRAAAIYSMAADKAVYRSIALRNGRIVAASPFADGLDGLATGLGRVVDHRSLTLLPAFIDTHNHLLEATGRGPSKPISSTSSINSVPPIVRNQ